VGVDEAECGVPRCEVLQVPNSQSAAMQKKNR
jgi:hypothetical protein